MPGGWYQRAIPGWSRRCGTQIPGAEPKGWFEPEGTENAWSCVSVVWCCLFRDLLPWFHFGGCFWATGTVSSVASFTRASQCLDMTLSFLQRCVFQRTRTTETLFFQIILGCVIIPYYTILYHLIPYYTIFYHVYSMFIHVYLCFGWMNIHLVRPPLASTRRNASWGAAICCQHFVKING